MSVSVQQPCLVVVQPAELRGQVLPISAGRATVGRGRAEVRLDDPGVSRFHAELSVAGGQTLVEDLGSTAGTTVNGAPLFGCQPLQAGDVVGFGPVLARYEPASGEPMTARSPAAGHAEGWCFSVRDRREKEVGCGTDRAPTSRPRSWPRFASSGLRFPAFRWHRTSTTQPATGTTSIGGW
jgi:pSer/pThr/pTyr-binding forkhead associated (FHA) protein